MIALPVCGMVSSESGAQSSKQDLRFTRKRFTSDKDHPRATALVVRDGKFVCAGDEAGLADDEGEITDPGGRKAILDFLSDRIKSHLGQERSAAGKSPDTVPGAARQAPDCPTEDSGLGKALFPDQVLLHLTGKPVS